MPEGGEGAGQVNPPPQQVVTLVVYPLSEDAPDVSNQQPELYNLTDANVTATDPVRTTSASPSSDSAPQAAQSSYRIIATSIAVALLILQYPTLIIY